MVSEALRVAVDIIVQVKNSDRILVIVDDSTEFLVNKLENILSKNEMKVLRLRNERYIPDDTVGDRDVVFLFTRNNLCFSPSIVTAVAGGKKVLCCARCTPAKLIRSIPKDLRRYHEMTKRLVSSLRMNSSFEVTSENGSKIIGNIDKFPPRYVGFLLDNENNFSILPGGIIGVPVIPDTIYGEILINGFVEKIGQINAPVLLKIEKGSTKVLNPSNAPKFLLEAVSSPWFWPCELGIGANPNSGTSEDNHESESELGVIDMGFGENRHIGGRIGGNIHFDVTTKRATLRIDGRLIIENGRVMV